MQPLQIGENKTLFLLLHKSNVTFLLFQQLITFLVLVSASFGSTTNGAKEDTNLPTLEPPRPIELNDPRLNELAQLFEMRMNPKQEAELYDKLMTINETELAGEMEALVRNKRLGYDPFTIIFKILKIFIRGLILG